MLFCSRFPVNFMVEKHEMYYIYANYLTIIIGTEIMNLSYACHVCASLL